MMSKLGVWPTPFLIQWILVALSRVAKQPGDRAVPSSVEVKNTEPGLHCPLCLHDMVLNKHKDTFTFTVCHVTEFMLFVN